MSGKLSEEQADDLLHIRQLLITRRCVLSVGRKAVVHQLSASDTQVLNPIDNIVTTEDLTTALRRNAAEDHELFYTVVRAVYRGVSLLANQHYLATPKAHASCPPSYADSALNSRCVALH